MTYLALLRRHPRSVAFGFLHALAATAGQTFVIAVFLPAVRVEFGLDAAQLAALFTATTVASALVLWRVGRAIDRADVVRYSFASGVVLAIGWVAAASAPSLPVFVLALFALRLGGNGLLNHIAVTATARHFVDDRGKALALVSIGFLFEALIGVAAVHLIGALGWRVAMVVMAALVMVVVAASAWLVRMDAAFRWPALPRAVELSRRAAARLGHAQPSARYFFMTAPLFVAPALMLTGFVFHQSALAEARGYSAEWFAAAFIGFAVSRLAASLLAGPLIDRYGPDTLFTVHLVPLGVGVALLALSSAPLVAPLFWICAGVTGGLSATLQVAVAAERVEPARLGALRSVLAAVVILSAAAGPMVYGIFIARGLAISLLLWASVAAMIGATLLGAAAQAGSVRRR